MSDHNTPPPPKPTRRGSAAGYDPFEWARHIVDALDLPQAQQPQHQQSEDELRDYTLFRENEKVRRATEVELMRLLKEGKFDIVSEFRFRRWELREWIDEIEREFWSQKDKESEQWK